MRKLLLAAAALGGMLAGLSAAPLPGSENFTPTASESAFTLDGRTPLPLRSAAKPVFKSPASTWDEAADWTSNAVWAALMPFKNRTESSAEFRSLLSLIDGAPIRARSAHERIWWLYRGYAACAALLALLALIYLPANAPSPRPLIAPRADGEPSPS